MEARRPLAKGTKEQWLNCTSAITDAFGAVITGLDPRSDFDDETRRLLRQLFDDRSVLVFPGIDIDPAYQDKLCRMLIGDDGPSTTAGRDPYYVSNKEPGGFAPYGRLMFHADMMWHPQPYRVLSLYAVNVEPGSPATILASGTHAWESLPAELRARVEGLHAVHITGQVYSRGGDDLLKPERKDEQSTITQIAHRHPQTGKTILYVSQQMTREIVELPHDESEELLQTLFSHLYDPARLYEHDWRTGDLVVFDNIAMQHGRGNVDADGPIRTLRKVVAPIPKLSVEKPQYANAR